MRFIFVLLCAVWAAGCSIQLSESDTAAFFERQIGRALPAKDSIGCDVVPLGDSVVEYVPRVLPKSGWAVVWKVDTSRAAELSAAPSEKLLGTIVAWRIIGDRSKVRIPVSYSAG